MRSLALCACLSGTLLSACTSILDEETRSRAADRAATPAWEFSRALDADISSINQRIGNTIEAQSIAACGKGPLPTFSEGDMAAQELDPAIVSSQIRSLDRLDFCRREGLGKILKSRSERIPEILEDRADIAEVARAHRSSHHVLPAPNLKQELEDFAKTNQQIHMSILDLESILAVQGKEETEN